MMSESKEQKLLDLMSRTGYEIIQENGQRLFGPPPDWPEWKPCPEKGCEVFVGRIPRDCYEDELVPVFARMGPIYQLRLMMDFSGTNRGYAFVTFTNQLDAKKAINQLNEYEIRPNKRIGVVKSVDNCRLFIGNIPSNKTKFEVIQEMSKHTEGVVNAIVYHNSNKLITNPFDNRNRGFAFVEYSSHRAAAMARRKLLPGKIQLFGVEITVDWAIPEPNLDEETMAKVTVLFVRYLSCVATEDMIKEIFSLKDSYNINVQRVKRIKNYAFVHFYNRNDAELVLKTITRMDLSNTGLVESGQQLEVTWAKPPNANTPPHKKSNHGFDLNQSFSDLAINQNLGPNYGSDLNPLASPFNPNSNVWYSKPSTSSMSNYGYNSNVRNGGSAHNSSIMDDLKQLKKSSKGFTSFWCSSLSEDDRKNEFPWIYHTPESYRIFH